MRTSRKKVNRILQRQINLTLAQVFVDIKTLDESEVFINSFFTLSEMEAFSKRLAVAYWLKKGRSYTNIKENLKVSSATIAAVQGQMKSEGFQLALNKMEADEWANLWSDRIKKFVGNK